MVSMWLIHGSFIDNTWLRLWMIYGLSMDYLWIIYGLSMDMVDISMAMTQEPMKIGGTYTIYPI